MPAKPRWLLAIPDAISQLEQLDRQLLTRRDIERLFGVGTSKRLMPGSSWWSGVIHTMRASTRRWPRPAGVSAGIRPMASSAGRRASPRAGLR